MADVLRSSQPTPIERVHVRAHAKVNLCLAVGPAEPATSNRPGWHKICSWMHAVDLYDEVSVVRCNPDDSSAHRVFRADGAAIDWTLESDLGVRALRAIERSLEKPLPARVEICKHIPTCAGLGGGSSNAAAVLIAINILFDLQLSNESLQRVGSELGSDVAFFIDTHISRGSTHDPRACVVRSPPRHAIVSGFGEVVERLDPLTPQHADDIRLYIQSFGCPTPAVFAAFDYLVSSAHTLQIDRVRDAVSHAVSHGVCATAQRGMLFNDLELAACRVQPELAEILDALRQSNVPTHMTGSGSSILSLGLSHGLPQEMLDAYPRRDTQLIPTSEH